MAKPKKPESEKYQKLTITVPPDVFAALVRESEQEERTLSDIGTRMLRRGLGGHQQASPSPGVDLSHLKDEITTAIQQQTDRYIQATESLSTNIGSHMRDGFNGLGARIDGIGTGISQIQSHLISLPPSQHWLNEYVSEAEQETDTTDSIDTTDAIVDPEQTAQEIIESANETHIEPEHVAEGESEPGQTAQETMTPAELAGMIEQFCKAQGITFADFGRKADVNMSNRAKWASGKAKPSSETVEKIISYIQGYGVE